MRVVIISETCQRFNGVRYYLCGKYFQNNGIRLHRVVWEHHRGPVPDGYHVHHRDEDRSHNGIRNLKLMKGGDHIAHHNNEPEKLERMRQLGLEMQPRTAAWHRSAEGREWHRQHHEATSGALYATRSATCSVCGNGYETTRVKYTRFCSKACKAEERRRSGVDDVTLPCAHCGKKFTRNKYLKRSHCSKRCSALARWAKGDT